MDCFGIGVPGSWNFVDCGWNHGTSTITAVTRILIFILGATAGRDNLVAEYEYSTPVIVELSTKENPLHLEG